MAKTVHPAVSAIILAGGEGRRMGGEDKGWLDLNGVPLIRHVIDRVRPQVSDIVISANRNLQRYHSLPFPIIQDSTPYLGPLGGIAACLKHITTEYALIIPTDAPLVPQDLVTQLYNHAPAPLVLCRDSERLQPLFGLYHRSLADSIDQFLLRGERKLGLWCKQHHPLIVTIGDNQVFTNLNSPEDIAKFEKNCHN
ncbi:MAG: molybdenum cofactor guanylyltransferase [Ketobacter sp.]|nr:MAG: molybdenum cofactor guanylyltransferase [Ketobacter sp.]